MVKSTVKILREFYREQDKEVDRTIDPDDDTETLVEILRVLNPIVRIAKRKKLSFTTTDGDSIIEVNPDDTHTVIGKIKSRDVKVKKRTISLR
jgi:hypothetical protein